ncbi:MAG: HDOD domain-containing protein, partial [Phycisphaerae bacterium]
MSDTPTTSSADAPGSTHLRLAMLQSQLDQLPVLDASRFTASTLRRLMDPLERADELPFWMMKSWFVSLTRQMAVDTQASSTSDSAGPRANEARLFDESASDAESLWMHAGFSAWMSYSIALHPDVQADPLAAFQAGWFHDVGKMVFLAAMPRSYARILRHTRHQRTLFCNAEIEMFGVDHAYVGAYLLGKWGFPDAVVASARYHHLPPMAYTGRQTAEVERLVALVQLADQFARRERVGLGDRFQDAVVNAGCRQLGIERHQIEEIGNAAIEIWNDQWISDVEAAGRVLTETVRNARDDGAAVGDDDLWERALQEVVERISASPRVADVVSAATTVLARLLKAYDGALFTWFDGESGACIGYTSPTHTDAPGDRAPTIMVGWNDPVENHETDRMRSGAYDPMAVRDDDGRIRSWWQKLGLRGELRELCVWRLDLGEGVHGVFVGNLPEPGRNLLRDARQRSRPLAGVLRMALQYALKMQRDQWQETVLLDHQRRSFESNREQLRSEVIAAISEMAAGAAHELNNPLANISGRAQLLLANPLDDRRQQWAETIVAQVGEATRIVDELVNFAKPPKPRAASRRLMELVDMRLQHWKRGSKSRGRSVSIAVMDPGLTVYVDADHFATILDALLDNAANAESKTIEINSPSSPSDEQVRIEMTDDGCGMTPEVVSHAADPFFSHRRAGRGRGLGLSLAMRLAEVNGGKLWIDSTPDIGTTVSLALPARAQRTLPAPRAIQTTP